jgi:hypothetical protein
LPDFTKPFDVDCDASGSGFGAILHEGCESITFFSRTMSPHHAKLAAYERELMDLVKAVCHWWSYLWTHPFIVRTDHYSLKYLLDQRQSTIPQHAWLCKLFGYQFSIVFKPEQLNAAADALSWCDEDTLAIHALSSPYFVFYD